MKDILDYPENTPGSEVDDGLLKLHESRVHLVLESFGGVSGFIGYNMTHGDEQGIAEVKRRFETIHNVKWPHNIKFGQ
ncbi:hypothetical protein Asfd1_20 [Aeromonas phage Asfd_1]|nr:hypothetical protein Asfd1_20 [Aeromonas phage Asfd_1]